MEFAVDSNLLVYASNPTAPFHEITVAAISKLLGRGESLYIFPQNLVEFWVASTRPISANGLGLSIAQAEVELIKIKGSFELLTERAAIYAEWEKLVVKHHVLGKNVHDARIVAQMVVHGIDNILTFNTKDFKRFTNITALDPSGV